MKESMIGYNAPWIERERNTTTYEVNGIFIQRFDLMKAKLVEDGLLANYGQNGHVRHLPIGSMVYREEKPRLLSKDKIHVLPFLGAFAYEVRKIPEKRLVSGPKGFGQYVWFPSEAAFPLDKGKYFDKLLRVPDDLSKLEEVLSILDPYNNIASRSFASRSSIDDPKSRAIEWTYQIEKADAISLEQYLQEMYERDIADSDRGGHSDHLPQPDKVEPMFVSMIEPIGASSSLDSAVLSLDRQYYLAERENSGPIVARHPQRRSTLVNL